MTKCRTIIAALFLLKTGRILGSSYYKIGCTIFLSDGIIDFYFSLFITKRTGMFRVVNLLYMGNFKTYKSILHMLITYHQHMLHIFHLFSS